MLKLQSCDLVAEVEIQERDLKKNDDQHTSLVSTSFLKSSFMEMWQHFYLLAGRIGSFQSY